MFPESDCFLVKFDRFFEKKDEIYAQMWMDFGVDSLFGYADYHEACMFAYAGGEVIESFYRYYKLEAMNVIAHFNEWMTGMGALYIKKTYPKWLPYLPPMPLLLDVPLPGTIYRFIII